MSAKTIILRNTVSGVSAPFEEKQAERLLADPKFGKILVRVDSEKPEVLSPPYEIDDDGTRQKIETVSTEPVDTIDDEFPTFGDGSDDEFMDSKNEKD